MNQCLMGRWHVQSEVLLGQHPEGRTAHLLIPTHS